MQERELTIPLEGRTLRGVRYGTGPRKVLALHGWLDNAESFSALAPLIVRDDVELVALDFCGHGLSEPPAPGASFHYLDHVADLAATVAHLQWDAFDLIGHSMGGGLALVYTALFPQQVRTLVSIDALGPMGQKDEETPKIMAEAVAARLSGPPPAREFATFDEAVDARCKDGHILRESAERLARRGVAETESGFVWTADRRHRLPSLSRLTQGQIRALLDAIACPVLVLWAKDSQYAAMVERLKGRADRLKNAHVLALSGGHHLHMDAPEPVAEAIVAFLSRSHDAG